MSFLDKSAYKYRSRYLNLTFIKLPRVPTHPYNTRYKAKITALRQRILYEVAEELAAKGPFQILKLSESRNELPNSESDVNVAQPRDSLEDSHSEDTEWLDSLEDSHSEETAQPTDYLEVSSSAEYAGETLQSVYYYQSPHSVEEIVEPAVSLERRLDLEDSSIADYAGETLQSVYYYQNPHVVEETVEPADSLESFQSGEETAQSIGSFEDSYSDIETIQPIDSLEDSHCEETVLPMNFLEDSSYTVDQERIQSMDASEDSSIAETEETVTSMDSSQDLEDFLDDSHREEDSLEDYYSAQAEETVTPMDSSEDSHSEESLDIYDF